MAQDSLAAIVYADQLRFLRNGEPLWQPEPMDEEVAIGDVGFVSDGRFVRLFNAVDGLPGVRGGIPEGFVKLKYDAKKWEERNDKYMQPFKPHSSKSVVQVRVDADVGAKGLGAGYSFKCKEQKGALVISGDYGASCFVLNNRIFREYVRRHHRSWCELAYTIGHDRSPEEILFVTGWLKTSEWAIAAILSEGRSHSFTLSADVGSSLAQAKLHAEVSQEVEVSAIHRSGPVGVTERRHNQCLFLRYYKVKYRAGPLKFLGMKIVAGAEPRDPESHHDSEGSAAALASQPEEWSDDDEESSFEGDEFPGGMQNDPIEHLLDYILSSNTAAEMAIACHEDLHQIYRSRDWPEDFKTSLSTLKPRVHVDSHGTGTVESDAGDRDGYHAVSGQAVSGTDPARPHSVVWTGVLHNAECLNYMAEYETLSENREECQAIYDVLLFLSSRMKDRSFHDRVLARLKRMLSEIGMLIQHTMATMLSVQNGNFLTRILHRRQVRSELKVLRDALQKLFTIVEALSPDDAPISFDELALHAQRVLQAHKRDEQAVQNEYQQMLDVKDDDLLQALGVEDSQILDAIVALSKYVDKLHDGPEKQLCQRGLEAMKRAGGETPIPIDHFAISSFEVEIHRGEMLGSGGYAEVYRGTYRGRSVAVKMFPRGIHWQALHQEVTLWKQLSHPNILRFLGANLISEPVFMISELKVNGHVHDYLRRVPNASRHAILQEASQGLLYLHEHSVIHGDIKGTNILINKDGSACISDFGISNVELQSSAAEDGAGWAQRGVQRGTARWMAPEQLVGRPASARSDVYNFAMTIYEIFTGRPPFANVPDDDLLSVICERGERPRWEDIPVAAHQLGLDVPMWVVAENCWAEDQQERWTSRRLSERLLFLSQRRQGALRQTSVEGVRAVRPRGRSLSNVSLRPVTLTHASPSGFQGRRRSHSTSQVSVLLEQWKEHQSTSIPLVEHDSSTDLTLDSLATPGMTMDWTMHSTYDSLMETGPLPEAELRYPASVPHEPVADVKASSPSISTSPQWMYNRDKGPQTVQDNDAVGGDEPAVPGSYW